MAEHDGHIAAGTCRLQGRRLWPAGRRLVRALSAAVLVAALAHPAGATAKPDWDQVENIKDAATRLAQLQRTRGATATFQFIDACYKTHSLSSKYTKAFEACIAQDYLETQVLTLIYSRLSEDTLKRMGAPTPEMLAYTMSRRISGAFATYKVPAEQIEGFKKLVDEHGFPVFFQALFPNQKVPVPKGLLQNKKQ